MMDSATFLVRWLRPFVLESNCYHSGFLLKHKVDGTQQAWNTDLCPLRRYRSSCCRTNLKFALEPYTKQYQFSLRESTWLQPSIWQQIQNRWFSSGFPAFLQLEPVGYCRAWCLCEYSFTHEHSWDHLANLALLPMLLPPSKEVCLGQEFHFLWNSINAAKIWWGDQTYWI